MRTELSRALDECLGRIHDGEAIDTCIAEFPYARQQLGTLLYTAMSLSVAPKASPLDEVRKISKARLMARLREESIQAKVAKSREIAVEQNVLAEMWQRLVHTIAGAREVVIPVILTMLLILGSSYFLSGTLSFQPAPSALASSCTITFDAGTVHVQTAGSDIWEEATNGIILEAGTRVRTTLQSEALLTFFEGSTVRLDPVPISKSSGSNV